MLRKRPKLLLTTGDPNGIGPEIILKIFSRDSFVKHYDLNVAGSKKIFDKYSAILSLPEISQERIIEIPLPRRMELFPGKLNKLSGKFSGDCISTAAELCIQKEFNGLITLPVSKEALNLGGYSFPGHTEMLTKLTSSDTTVMILYSEKFSVALVTGHLSLNEVSKEITSDLLFSKILTANNSLVKDFKIKHPKIAVLSLNPHAGDGGLIGKEEINIINPLIEKMNSAGFNIRGPFSPDAYFAGKTYKKYDITIAMYHDQGLIPFKMISFEKGVNFTAGLKIIRTSPDHGTAFDIAGLGKANPASTIAAIKLASGLAKKNN